MKPRQVSWIGLALVLLVACGGGGGDDDIVCTAEARSGVGVVLTSVATGLPIEGATVTLTEGAYSEVLWDFGAGQYAGAWERAGVYDLTVAAPGYVTGYRSDIVVPRDECHVIPVGLRIELEPK